MVTVFSVWFEWLGMSVPVGGYFFCRRQMQSDGPSIMPAHTHTATVATSILLGRLHPALDIDPTIGRIVCGKLHTWSSSSQAEAARKGKNTTGCVLEFSATAALK